MRVVLSLHCDGKGATVTEGDEEGFWGEEFFIFYFFEYTIRIGS
jgi:hypothetical protein